LKVESCQAAFSAVILNLVQDLILPFSLNRHRERRRSAAISSTFLLTRLLRGFAPRNDDLEKKSILAIIRTWKL
jgi:hypothetical protein